MAPATWRSREYADAVRYLLLRCFKLELVVEDTQPGWFSDALIRTHLVIARRLSSDETALPLSQRRDWGSARWLQVAPRASDGDSLVGAAFPGLHPEFQFAVWAFSASPQPVQSIQVRPFSLREEWTSLAVRTKRKSWQRKARRHHGQTAPVQQQAVFCPATTPRDPPRHPANKGTINPACDAAGCRHSDGSRAPNRLQPVLLPHCPNIVPLHCDG